MTSFTQFSIRGYSGSVKLIVVKPNGASMMVNAYLLQHFFSFQFVPLPVSRQWISMTDTHQHTLVLLVSMLRAFVGRDMDSS